MWLRSDNSKAIGALALIAIFCAWPLVMFGYPANGDDVPFHFFYTQGFFRGLAAGEVYPRWLSDLEGGLGAPSFYFYGPVAYYISSAVAFVAGLRDGLDILAATMPLILFASGLSAFVWLRTFVSAWPAAVGAGLYMIAPYHLLIDHWVRGDFAEAAAYIWIPLCFRAVEEFRARNIRGFLLLPPAIALLTMTHVIAAVLTLAALGVYALIRLRSWPVWLGVTLAGASGLAMAGIYLLPMTMLQQYVVVPHVPMLDAAFIFGPRGTAAVPEGASALSEAHGASLVQSLGARPMRRMLDVLFLVEIACVVVMALFSRALKPTSGNRLARFWIGLTASMLILMTIWFAPLWRLVPIYNQVQYPYRLFCVVDLGLVTAATLLIGEFAMFRRHRLFYVPILILVVAIGAGEGFIAVKGAKFDASRRDWITIRQLQDVEDAFRPLASAGLLPIDRGDKRVPEIAKARIASGIGEVHIDRWQPERIDLDVRMSTAGTVDVAQLWIPLWEARSSTGRLVVQPSPDMGLIEIVAPPGDTRITLGLATSVAEQIGTALSAVGLLAWLSMGVLISSRTARRYLNTCMWRSATG